MYNNLSFYYILLYFSSLDFFRPLLIHVLLFKQSKFHEINYKRSLEEAYALAQSAIPLSIFERLRKFSYISRVRNMQGSMIQPYDEQDDEISSTPTQHITLKEFYFRNKHYTKDKFFIN